AVAVPRPRLLHRADVGHRACAGCAARARGGAAHRVVFGRSRDAQREGARRTSQVPGRGARPRLSVCEDGTGAEGSRWIPRSSKPVARRSASRGGFDSHALPPLTRTMPGVRPPSVDAVLRAAQAGLDGRDRAAVRAVAREVVAEERSALAGGSKASSADELAATMLRR